MSISSVNGTDSYAQYRQRLLDLMAQSDTKQTGDTTATQTAAVSAQSVTQPGSTTTTDSSESATSAPVSIAAQIKADLSNILSAVQSGDMTSAQTALQAYQTDTQGFDPSSDPQTASDPTATGQTQGPHRHHHHHHGGPNDTQSADNSANGIDPTTTDGSTSTATNSNDPIENLLQQIGQTLESTTGVKVG